MRVAASIVTDVLIELTRLTAPDVSLGMLDELAERMIVERGGRPYNKGYQPDWAIEPYPATICAAVNHEICHAPPGNRLLRDGDIVTYDLGVKYGIGCGDAAITVAVGNISNRKQRAMRYGLQVLMEGIKKIKAGAYVCDVSRAIENFSTKNGYAVIGEFAGHHIGREMHEKPDIPNVVNEEYSSSDILEEGGVICIEPMITPGNGRVALSSDKWTAFCPDGQPVVMFEHQILVTAEGSEILTKHLPKQ